MVDIYSEKEHEAERLCVQGIELYESKEIEKAHEAFNQAFELHPNSAKAMSWLGLTTAIVEKRVARGLELCRKSLESQMPDAYFYRNIGKVYILQNNKRAAVGAFAKGLKLDKTFKPILDEWKDLGFRRKPFIKFLDRSHWINKMFGKWSHNQKVKKQGKA